MRTSYPQLGQLSDSSGHGGLSTRGRDPIARAWAILIGAFVVFLVLVAAVFVGAKRYYDTASLPRSATLSLEQGIVLFRDAVSSNLINAHDGLELREGDELLLGQGARASILLAQEGSIKLYAGSQLKITEFRRSRFHDGFSRVAVSLEKGTARVEVGTPPTKENRFQASTPFGYASLGSGSFGLDVSEERARISSRDGSANVVAGSGQALIVAGEKALLTKTGLTGPAPAGDQLVVNGDFAQGFLQWEKLDQHEPGRPVEQGQRMLATERVNGRDVVALRVSRVSPLGTHNETGLVQTINKDVSDYTSLRLTADVRVDDQSLSGGGYMGYEYPIMLRVRYRDDSGAQINWSIGFFYKNLEQRPTPNGQEVQQGQWYSWDVDLMSAQPKPAHIISVEVLGAGHTFAGMIANVGIVGK
ncbi:MAG: FecR domain-containing protein [Sphingomonadaceae bacterium]